MSVPATVSGQWVPTLRHALDSTSLLCKKNVPNPLLFARVPGKASFLAANKKLRATVLQRVADVWRQVPDALAASAAAAREESHLVRKGYLRFAMLSSLHD